MSRKAAKLAAAEGIRRRIRERMAFLHTNQDAIDKKCGFGHGFLNDFLVGRKHSMNADAMGRLIEALETTRDYLLLGQGSSGFVSSENPISQASDQIVLAPFQGFPAASAGYLASMASQISGVSDLHPAEIAIESLDLVTGEIMFRAARDAKRNKGVVLDPAVFLANNDYARAFASREPLAIFGKTVTFQSGQTFLAVLHSGPEKR